MFAARTSASGAPSRASWPGQRGDRLIAAGFLGATALGAQPSDITVYEDWPNVFIMRGPRRSRNGRWTSFKPARLQVTRAGCLGSSPPEADEPPALGVSCLGRANPTPGTLISNLLLNHAVDGPRSAARFFMDHWPAALFNSR
jgi:hypothetical protein